MYFALGALLRPRSACKAGDHQESLIEKLFQAINILGNPSGKVYLPSYLPQVILHMS